MRRPAWAICENCACMENDECRARPPKHNVGAGAEGRYPKVLKSDWCVHDFIATDEVEHLQEPG